MPLLSILDEDPWLFAAHAPRWEHLPSCVVDPCLGLSGLSRLQGSHFFRARSFVQSKLLKENLLRPLETYPLHTGGETESESATFS